MDKKYKSVFLILVIVQVCHSIEEYFGALWDVFPPATALCRLVSKDLELGFLIINIGFFILGMIVWLFPVRLEYTVAKYFVWFWIILELVNGIGHTVWAVINTTYKPGLLTAPFLFAIALYLAVLMKRLNDDDKAHFAE